MSRLETMPNGEVVEVDDNITPAALNSIKQQNMPTRAQRIASGQSRVQSTTAPDQQEVTRRADQYEKDHPTGWAHPLNTIQQDVARPLGHGIFAGFDDEIRGGISAAVNSAKNLVGAGNGNSFGKEYQLARDADREITRRAGERVPAISTAAEIAGAVTNPVGDAGVVLRGAGAAARAVRAERAGKALTIGAERVAQAGALPTAVQAGATQGALNAAGNADNLRDIPNAAIEGGTLGAITGGALGYGSHLGMRGLQILGDASKKNAERTAYSRIASLLESGSTDAAKVRSEILDTDANGGDAMVMDQLPSLRALAGSTSRKPGVTGSNEMIERGEQRIVDRRARFGDQVRTTVDMPAGGADAFAHGDTLAATRKQAGQTDYAKGGVMDTPITPTPELQTYLKNAPEQVNTALKGAYNNMLLRDEKPADFVGDDGIFTHIPNLRTFDYVKRAFDTQIGQALKSGDKSAAQGLSFQLDKLKGVLADANPNDAKYQSILKSQRDLFQQQKALDIGKDILSRLPSRPREVMRDLNALPDHAVDDARIGIVDALINTDSKADPVANFRSIMRNDSQRKVMEFAFGGKGNLGRFERWVGRETRATRADVLTAPGRQSETARFGMADSDVDGGNVGNILSNALRGYAFGGAPGAFSGISRTLQSIASGSSKPAQEEIAKILMSKGENLESGINATAAFRKSRQIGNRVRARNVAKGAQQIFTDGLGGE